jgi:hypothetical protein
MRTSVRAVAVASLLAVGSFVALQWPGSAGAVRAEGIAALIGSSTPGPGTDVILHSDVALRARIRMTGRIEGPPRMAPLPRALMRKTLDEMMGEALIAREAERIRVAVPDRQDVAEQRRRIAQMAGGEDRLQRLLQLVGASPGEVDAMARRRARVQVFLEANLEGTNVVTDSELEHVYESGEHPFTDRPFAEVKAPLRRWLAARAIDRAVRHWVRVLRSRTEMRVLARYAPDRVGETDSGASKARQTPKED